MLQRTAEYALRIAVWLAQSPGSTQRSQEIAKGTRIPARYLYKVLQALVRGGFVGSQPGPGGGYSLLPPPDEVRLLDIVHVFGPIDRVRTCPLGLKSHTSLCPLHRRLDEAYAAIEKALGQVTLGELLREPSRVPPLVEARN